MKGNPMMVTSESRQDIPHMTMKSPAPLMAFRRKMLTFWEMRSLTWVVSADRRDRMSPTERRRRVRTALLFIRFQDGRTCGVFISPVWFSSKKAISCLIRVLKRRFLRRRFNLAIVRVKTPPRTPIESELRRGWKCCKVWLYCIS